MESINDLILLYNLKAKKGGRAKSKGRSRSPKGRSRSPKGASGPPKPPVDVLDPPAMENLDLIAHNAPDALAYRNNGWPKGKKKKKK